MSPKSKTTAAEGYGELPLEQLEAIAKSHLHVGQTVMVLTRGYHWVGRIASVTALQLVLVQTTCFVNIGQLDAALSGRWDDRAKGRQSPPLAPVAIYRPGSEVIDWPYELPSRPIGS